MANIPTQQIHWIEVHIDFLIEARGLLEILVQEAKYLTFYPKLLKIGPFYLFFTLGNLSLTLKTAALTFVASQEPVGGAAFVI